MASKITDDMTKAQWSKQNNAHDAHWNAVVHIAEAVGLKLDDKGNVIGKTEKAQSVVHASSSSGIDMASLNQAVSTAIKVNMPTKAELTTEIVYPKGLHIENNKKVLKEVTATWDPYLQNVVDTLVEAKAVAFDALPEPIIEERIVQRIVKVHKALGKILRWIVQDMGSSIKKFAAYNFAICCALFGAYQYYQNQQLLTQSKKDAVVRYILSGAPANKAMIEKIDTLLEQKGVDNLFKPPCNQK